ncbi:hypothetical protein E3N88_08839 [Mikania micrantha]|uniref:Helitron helicase-like domain-containing protein n=1 Tax=Mikania micrantha TaxID=192012 RepID=A0A5N6PJN3_9ASTR|nr:hypothetical protein E3N88_08839 [Mikania micrantha]
MSKRKRYRGECRTPLEHALTSNDNTPYQSPTQLSHRSTLLCNSRQNMTFYLDVGDCDRVCEFCDSFFWYDELLLASSVNRNPRYNHCCKGGAVTLPYQRQYDVDVIRLFKRTEFLDNIRAYNSMFSMTSFGAKIDKHVNDGSGPYVFKIEGQIHHWLGTLCPPPNQNPRFLQMYIYDTENELTNRLRAFTSDTKSSLDPEIVKFLINTLENHNELVKLFRTARDLCSTTNVPTFSIRLFASHHAQRYDTPSPRCIGNKEEVCHLFVDNHARAYIDIKKYFEAIIQVKSCYTVTKYVVENTSYMPMLKHEASLKIGKKAQFEPLSDDSIPHYFFQFASYDDLDDRMKPPKQLTALKQLESTYSTEVFVNPDFDNIQQHICRLRQITTTDVTQPTEKTITIHDLLDQLSTAGKLKFTCAERIKDIQAYRKWFYVQCSKCRNTLYLELGDSPCYVCKNHDDIEAKFMYCVKATVADETTTTNVVFFDQVMTEMLGISCQDMVILKGHDNPKIPPPEMLSLIGVPMTFTLTIKAANQSQ